MTHAALFLSAFATVFLLGIQQQNVHGRHYLAAVVTSLGIGAAQIFLWRLVPSASQSEIAATLTGGPIGIVASLVNIDPTVVLVPFNPTAENMAEHLVKVVAPQQLAGTGIVLTRCKIEETAKCSATFAI